MRRALRVGAAGVLLTALLVITAAGPAGAQQIIDAGKERQGGLAFVAFAIMVMLTAGALFFMDRVRRRREERDEPDPRA